MAPTDKRAAAGLQRLLPAVDHVALLFRQAGQRPPVFEVVEVAGGQRLAGLKWEGFEPGRWLLASSTNPGVMGWTWLWQIAPTADGQATRLLNRIRIQPMGVGDNPVASFFIGNGAFIMEQRMMNGIKAHAQGWVEPTYQEAVEIALWVVALLAGLAGAVLFVARRPWSAALAVAVVAVGVILVFTFAQPSIAVRVLQDGALLAGVWAAGASALCSAQPHYAPDVFCSKSDEHLKQKRGEAHAR